MTKILKKSLACLLVFALCFTAIAGCLAVSAEKPVSSIFYDVMELSNDNKEWQLCPGETVRGYVQVNGIKANTTVGIKLELPKHAEITKINPFGSAAGQEIKRYFDAEEGILTIIFKVAKDGYWNHLVYFNVTDATPKGVVYYDCTVDAAIKSNDSDDDHYINTVSRHFEVKAHEAAAAVHENIVEATCTTDGSYDEVVYCKWGDNEEISRNTVTVDALGHAWDEGKVDPDATCTTDGVITYTCKNDPSHTKTEAISKKDHTPAADLVDNKDGTHSEVCDVCGAKLSTADHDFTNGDCACGAKKPSQGVTEDPNLKFQGVSMAFGTSSLEMNFRVRQTVLNLYDRVELVIIPKKYNKTTKNYATPEEIVVQESQMGGTSIRTYQYTDMMLYELALDVQYKLRAYDGDVLVAESALASKSAVSYLKNDVLNGTGAGITEDLKRVAVDMLIVCEEARIAMNNVADSDLDRDSKITVLEGVNLNLATPEVNKNHNKVNNFDPSADGWGILDTDKYYVKTSVAMEKVPVLSLRITDNREFDLSKFNIKVSYTSAGSAGYVEENLTCTRSGKFIITKFSNVGLHDSNADITLEFSYDGKVTGTLTYSIETFLGSSLEDPTIGELAAALLNLGESFRTLKGY